MENLKLCVGVGEYEGKAYTYIYVNVLINGVETELKLKPYSTFEKAVLVNEIAKITKNSIGKDR